VVDENLLTEQPADLAWLFLDLNAYFASVEQQEHPELRNRPVAVVPVLADSSSVIAASYEAKRFGIRCGTQIGEAKERCPDITLISGRAGKYVEYHHRILEAVETVLPIDKVCSIDEMRFHLLRSERDPERVTKLAQELKSTLKTKIGECIRCSIGVAPNPFLAKLATEMQKPDGLVLLRKQDLPHALHKVALTDFPGVNRRMRARLNAAGIFDTAALCAADRRDLAVAFGSIIGERWWYLLRGIDVREPEVARHTLSHSHVLPPELRTDEGCRRVILRLMQKAAARLRANGLWTSSVTFWVKAKRPWESHVRVPATQDTVALTETFHQVWEARDFHRPLAVGVVFADLRQAAQVTPSLFDQVEERSAFNSAVDDLNRRFGKHAVYLADIESVRHTAQEKIAFQKTWLFSEGKGDHDQFPQPPRPSA